MSRAKRCDACRDVYDDDVAPPLHVSKYRWFGVDIKCEVVDLCEGCFRGLKAVYDRLRDERLTKK